MTYKTFLASLALAGKLITSDVYAQDNLVSDINNIKDEVKRQHNSFYTTRNAPLDTVFVFHQGNKSIESGKDFISIKNNSSDGGSFIYDIHNDGETDRAILTDGKLEDHEEALVDLEGLGGASGLELKVDLNKIRKRAFGETPYNTRRVYAVDNRNDLVIKGDFKKDDYILFGGEAAEQGKLVLRSFLEAAVKKSKEILGISN